MKSLVTGPNEVKRRGMCSDGRKTVVWSDKVVTTEGPQTFWVDHVILRYVVVYRRRGL